YIRSVEYPCCKNGYGVSATRCDDLHSTTRLWPDTRATGSYSIARQMKPLMNVWNRTGLGLKLSLSNFLLIALLTGSLIAAIGYTISRTIEQREEREMATRTDLLVELIAASDRDVRQRAQALSDAFMS